MDSLFVVEAVVMGVELLFSAVEEEDDQRADRSDQLAEDVEGELEEEGEGNFKEEDDEGEDDEEEEEGEGVEGESEDKSPQKFQ